MDKRTDVKDMETVSKAESQKYLKKQKEREDKAKARENSMFDLLNSACGSGSTTSQFTVKKNSISSNTSPPKVSNQVKGLKLSQSIEKLKGDILRLEESARRHQGKDQATYNMLQSRLKIKKTELISIEKDANNHELEKAKERERKKITVF